MNADLADVKTDFKTLACFDFCCAYQYSIFVGYLSFLYLFIKTFRLYSASLPKLSSNPSSISVAFK